MLTFLLVLVLSIAGIALTACWIWGATFAGFIMMPIFMIILWFGYRIGHEDSLFGYLFAFIGGFVIAGIPSLLRTRRQIVAERLTSAPELNKVRIEPRLRA